MEHRLLLLGLLRRQGMHGYQLFEFIEKALTSCTDLKKPTAYYLLGRMAEEGLVAESHEQEGNRPPRRVYRLTAHGEQEFTRLLRENLASNLAVIFPGDTGLAFLDDLPREEAARLLLERRQALAAGLEETAAIPDHGGSLQLLIEHRRHHLRSELSWLDQVLARLESGLP